MVLVSVTRYPVFQHFCQVAMKAVFVAVVAALFLSLVGSRTESRTAFESEQHRPICSTCECYSISCVPAFLSGFYEISFHSCRCSIVLILGRFTHVWVQPHFIYRTVFPCCAILIDLHSVAALFVSATVLIVKHIHLFCACHARIGSDMFAVLLRHRCKG